MSKENVELKSREFIARVISILQDLPENTEFPTIRVAQMDPLTFKELVIKLNADTQLTLEIREHARG